jgi:4-hydroxy-2-oxoheptanedioate aldolase
MHSIKQRLAQQQSVHIFSVGAIPSPKIIEIVGMLGGFHGIWLDEEHAAISQRDFEILALACRSVGLDSYARVAPTDYASVMRPMEAGIGGIMAAQVRSVAEVEQVVSWARFPPVGIRGINPSNFEGHYTMRSLAEIIESGNRDRWVSVQIETTEALSCVEQIAKVPGLDHLFVGPADLSVALGVPGQYLHESCRAALERVSSACEAAGKTWGILVRGPEHAEFCKSIGCRLFAFGNDLGAVIQGVKSIQSTYGSMFS